MVYSFARVSAAVAMKVGDYYPEGKRWRLRLHEKGGKLHQVPAHHNAEAYIDAWIAARGEVGKRDPLFPTIDRHGVANTNPMSRSDELRIIKRRVRAAELAENACCHTFRATGITAYLENGGTVETAQAIAAHESPRTTKLYDCPPTRSPLTRSSGLGFEVVCLLKVATKKFQLTKESAANMELQLP